MFGSPAMCRLLRRPFLAAILACPMLAAGTAPAIEPAVLAQALEQTCIEPTLVQHQIEQLCLSRIPALPEFNRREDWEAFARNAREETLSRVVFRGAAADWRARSTQPEWLGEIDHADYRIRKLRFEVVPGQWIPALLYEPKTTNGQAPAVLNVNGHDPLGKAVDYKQARCINLVKRGMLVLNLEWFGMGQLQGPQWDHYKQNQLDLCGTSGVSCFYLAMSRGLDLLLAHEHADPNRVAVSGLSGGGWQTIFISSLDERVTLANPVAGYSSFRTRALFHSDLGDSEQTPTDLATTADYAVLTAMRAPRPTLLTFNDRDRCCFDADHALVPLLDAARPVYRLYGAAEALQAHVNHVPGSHNYERDNREALYRIIGEFWYAGQPFNTEELDVAGELHTPEELNVELPADNAGFPQLAKRLAAELPRTMDAPPEAQRERLRQVLRHAPLSVTNAELVGTQVLDGCEVHRWRLNLEEAFTLPATEFVPENARSRRIIIADAGRAACSEQVASLMAEKVRVLAVDPLMLGESKIPSRDFLFGLLVSAVGERPLGVQAAQLNAAARWWTDQADGPVELTSTGRRTGLAALCAAAVDETAFSGVETIEGLNSLKDILELDLAIPDGPELFCFGLLELFDIPQLRNLAAPQAAPRP